MATADHVKALVRSHTAGDDTMFYSIALQVAARAARGGQSKFAQEMRDLIDQSKKDDGRKAVAARSPVLVPLPRGELADLLSVSYPDIRQADLVLEDTVREQLQRVITEQRQRDQLQEHGFRPLRRVLLLGPPGTGKTFSAQMFAGELRLPLFMLRLDGVFSRFMGETAAKLRLVFDALTETRGVYLFDEVDALGGGRANSNDVGEIRRVLNSFLQFLEQGDPESLLVATSNHPELLDKAMFRRFDAVIEYPLPDHKEARAVIRNRLASVSVGDLAWNEIDEASTGLSHADITQAAEQAAKNTILAGFNTVTTAGLVEALNERRGMPVSASANGHAAATPYTFSAQTTIPPTEPNR